MSVFRAVAPLDLNDHAPTRTQTVDVRPTVERAILRHVPVSDRALIVAMLFGPIVGDDPSGRAKGPRR